MDHEHALLLTRHIKPDHGFYVQGDDRLSCTAFSSVASLVVRFSGYFLSANGEVREYAIDVAPTSDRAVTSAIQFFGEGFILSCVASLATGNANRGQVYARARIQRGTGATAIPIVRLLAGYVTDDYTPSFPYGHIDGPLEGPGMLRAITGTNPAAGAEILETVPTGARWRLVGMSFVLVTDATVATRLPQVFFDDGVTQFLRIYPSSGAAASSTIRFQWAIIGTQLTTSATNYVLSMLPMDFFLPAGWRIGTATNNIQAADDYAAPQLMVEEWIEA